MKKSCGEKFCFAENFAKKEKVCEYERNFFTKFLIFLRKFSFTGNPTPHSLDQFGSGMFHGQSKILENEER